MENIARKLQPQEVEVFFNIENRILIPNVFFTKDNEKELVLEKVGPVEAVHIPKLNILYYTLRPQRKEES